MENKLIYVLPKPIDLLRDPDFVKNLETISFDIFEPFDFGDSRK